MSLGGYKIRMIRKLYHLHYPSVRRHPGQYHSVLCQDLSVIIVDFISVTVPFRDLLLPVQLICLRTFRKYTRIRPEPERAAYVFKLLLLGQYMDNGIACIGGKLR